MLFNSWTFLAFFAVVALGYLLLRHRHQAQNHLLLAASYAFYGAWDYRFLALIGFSTLVDFVVGNRIPPSTNPTARKRLLWLSLAANLGTLGFFKYYNFFAGSLAELLQLDPHSVTLSIVLPVGISFYTFQSMAYTIDIYRGELEPCQSLADFALYVSFFPQLVAGPIERAGRLLKQIQSPRKVTAQDVEVGIHLILWGYYKKVVIADNLAPIVEKVFAGDASAAGADVWLGLLAFAFQIYGDFSGYSSIARGLARLLGFNLVRNFRNPYFALTPSDFWQRWHISLSQWLRDYLYVPLGGNRGEVSRTYRNLLLTMILGGLWHGAAWNFCIWGAYHGILLCLYRAAGISPAEGIPGRFVQWVFMSFFTLYGWLLFRADSLDSIGTLSLKLTSFSISVNTFSTFSDLLFYLLPLLVMEAWQFYRRDSLVICRCGVGPMVIFQGLVLFSIITFGARESVNFLYFQF